MAEFQNSPIDSKLVSFVCASFVLFNDTKFEALPQPLLILAQNYDGEGVTIKSHPIETKMVSNDCASFELQKKVNYKLSISHRKITNKEKFENRSAGVLATCCPRISYFFTLLAAKGGVEHKP